MSTRLLITFLLLNCFSVLQAQKMFHLTFNSTSEELPFRIKQVGNSYILPILMSDQQWGSSTSQYTKIIKLQLNGEQNGEIDFNIGNNSFFSTYDIIPIDQSSFYTLSRSKLEGNAFAQINIMKIDTTLAVQWSRNYVLNKQDLGRLSGFINPNGNLIIGMSPCSGNASPDFNLLFMDVNSEGDSIRAVYNNQGKPYSTSLYSIIQSGSVYKAFVSGYDNYINYNGFTEILTLDTSFTIQSIKPVPYTLNWYLTAENLDSLSYVVAGMYYSSDTHADVGLVKLTNEDDSIAFNHAGKPGLSVDYSAVGQCLSILNTNVIYAGGTGGDNGLFYNCFPLRKVFMLSNYDSLLNCRWTRFYGNDSSCFIMTALDATSDGGCIMAGSYYTPSLPDNLLDALVLKVDSTGIITGTSPVVEMHDAFVYPNPGNDILNIQSGPQVTGAIFTLFDISGKPVLETKLHSILETLITSQIPSGTYVWSIQKSNKKVDMGKWIKE